MRVLVIGGGIGGMSAAIALEKEGLDPLVFEQAPELVEIGAGIGMHANAMQVLNHLGAGDFIRDHAMRIDRGEWRRLEDGETVFTQGYAGMADHYGEHYYCMHRADLLESLIRQVPQERILLDHCLVDVEERPDGVVARFANGEEAFGDALIGADGLRSVVRSTLFGEQEARFTGFAAWRGGIPMDRMPAGYEHALITWPGQGRHCMTYPLRPDLQTFNGFVPTTEILREEWGPSGDLADLKRSFAGATADVLTLIDLIDEALITPINFRDPIPVWSTERVALLGDAAHPTPPSAGQGGAMALEDSVTLAACLGRAEGVAGLGPALAEYCERRRRRAAGMVLSARNNLGMFNEPDPEQIRARDGRLRGLLRTDPVGESMFGWLYGFDAVGAARRPLPDPASLAPPRRRPEARRAHRLWEEALTWEDRSRLWVGEREGYERFTSSSFPWPDEVTVESVDAGGVPALRVTPHGAAGDSGPVVVHLHGGLYSMGSARGAVEYASRLAEAVGGWALVPDYRLAPEHPFPAGLDDVVTAYRWLLSEIAPRRIVLSGECAGGSLAIALAVRLRDAGDRLPAVIHAVSPLADLTVTSPSATLMPSPDGWLDRDRLRILAASYTHGADPSDAEISPVHADLHGLPPMLLEVASDEAIVDDVVRLAEAGKRAGVPVTLVTVEDSVHSFALFRFLPEAAAALERLAAASETAAPAGSSSRAPAAP